MVSARCRQCGNDFMTWKFLVKKDYGKFCSKECHNLSMQKPEKEKKEANAARQRRYRKQNPGSYQANPEYMSRWSASKYYEIKDKIFSLLGDECNSCGFQDKRALCIDHVNGGGNKEMKSMSHGILYYKMILKKIQEGSKDYQTLCHNCNWLKRWERREVRKGVAREEKIVKCRCGCEEEINQYDTRNRIRRYISGHNTVSNKVGV